MNPNPLSLLLDRSQMHALAILIDSEQQSMYANIHRMRGQDYLTYKILVELQNRFSNKVQHWHKPTKKYRITLDKGEAWVMIFHFNARIEEYHPVKQLLGEFHQKLI